MPEKNPFFGATFAERKAAREAAEKDAAKPAAKAVQADEDDAENKAVRSSETKAKRARKKP